MKRDKDSVFLAQVEILATAVWGSFAKFGHQSPMGACRAVLVRAFLL